jgi:hypothetical protein
MRRDVETIASKKVDFEVMDASITAPLVNEIFYGK